MKERGEESENCSIKCGPETQTQDQRWRQVIQVDTIRDWVRWQHPDQARARARLRVR